MNLLITSAGRRVSLVRYFMQEARRATGIIKIYAADHIPDLSSACRISDNYFKVLPLSDSNYISQLLELCLENNIKVVVPTIDTELLILAKNRELFRKSGVEVVVSDVSVVKICRNKNRTHDYFIEKGIEIPKSVDKYNPSFPLFIKPIDGSSSQDLYHYTDKSQLSEDIVNRDNLIWMEYLSKDDYIEYTIDCYYNKDSNLKCCVPRVRIAVRGGETNKGITQKNEVLIEYIKKRFSVMNGARGCITLQLFQSKEIPEKIYGIEINPRFGGGYPLSYLAGANYPKWIIDEYILDKEVDSFDQWEDNLLLLRYDQEMIVNDYQYTT